jgi:ribosomal protein S6--L-glutamate ligase
MRRVWVITDERYLAQAMPTAVVEELRRRGHPVRLLVADRHRLEVRDGSLTSPLADLVPGDLVVCRSRHPLALGLLDAAEQHGGDCPVPAAAVERVRDKVRCLDVLVDHELPVPDTVVAADPSALREVDPGWFPLLLKPHLGDNARGIRYVAGPDDLDDLDWRDSMVLAQRFVDARGWDVKLYVCGGRIWAVRRRSPLLPDASRVPAEPMPLTPGLARIAERCRDAFGLPLCGIDVVVGDAGPVVVDVNEFPNYTGVDDAGAELADLLVGAVPAGGDPVRLAPAMQEGVA